MTSKPPAGDGTHQEARIITLKSRCDGGGEGWAWDRATDIAIIGLFTIALLWCAYVAQHVIVPVLLAWSVATIVLPVVKWMERAGIPRIVAAIAVAVLLIGLILALVLSRNGGARMALNAGDPETEDRHDPPARTLRLQAE